MSQVSKKKFWEALKKEPEDEHSLFEIFKKPVTQEQWLKGYKQWKKQQSAYNKRTDS